MAIHVPQGSIHEVKLLFMPQGSIHFLTFSRKISVCLILQGESAAIPPAPLAAEPLRKMPSVALDEASFKRRSKKRT